MAYSLCSDMLRLHVVADNDTEKSQRLKMRVVMTVRKMAARLVFRCVNGREAFAIMSGNAREIERRARLTARLAGFFGKVKVDCGVYAFPECVYGDTLVAAGDYRAVRVTLGVGAGHNWWCVLYPELCAVDECVAKVLLDSESVEFFSAIGRFFQGLFHGVGL